MLQIDSHSRFAEGWDRRLVEMLASIDDLKPLLTTYPPSYQKLPGGYEELAADTGIGRVALEALHPDLTTSQRCEPAPDPSQPGPCAFVATSFIFASGRFLLDVPPDPQLGSSGEEIAVAARAYTHGYNLYYPSENLVWQLNPPSGSGRGQDQHTDGAARERSMARLHQLLVGDWHALGPYGLGRVRELAAYEKYAMVDFGRSLDPARR